MKRWMKWAALMVMCLAVFGLVRGAEWKQVTWDNGKYTSTTIGVDSCSAAPCAIAEMQPGQVDTSDVLDLRAYLWANVFIHATSDSMRGFVQKSWNASNWIHQDSFVRADTGDAYAVLYDSTYTKGLGKINRLYHRPAPFMRFIIAQHESGQELLYAGTDSAEIVPKDYVKDVTIGVTVGN